MKKNCILILALTFHVTLFAQQKPRVIQTTGTRLAIPEGIAVDSRNNNIYVTSIWERKILLIKEDGSHRDFIKSGDDDFGQGLGIKVDEKRNRVWAVSNEQLGRNYRSNIHAFNANTGLSEVHFTVIDTANHFFNDFVLDEKGNAYITATMSGELFFANAETKKIEMLVKDSLIQYPNGIELKNNKLYIATYSNGPVIFDLSTKKLSKLLGYKNERYAYNLDGFGFYKNSLFAVHNGDSVNAANAIVEYVLDAKGTKIIEEKILDKGHSLFKEPTTLAISGNKLYLLANSNLRAYNNNKESAVGIEESLTPVTVLIYELK